MDDKRSGSFSIAGLGAGFADRQKNLFACLDAAEQERQRTRPTPTLADDDIDDQDHDRHGHGHGHGHGPDDRPGRRQRAPTMKKFRGKESIFKRPSMPAPKRARPSSVPDHQRNPHKYTKYSLGDVSPQDMSDRSNTAAALSFLQELKSRKDRQEEEMDVDGALPKTVVFKPTRSKTDKHGSGQGSASKVSTSATSEEAERPSFRSSRLVMPEYVVGQKKTSRKKTSSVAKEGDDKVKKSEGKEIKLGHLMEEEDE